MPGDIEWDEPTPAEKAMIDALIRYQYGVDPASVLPPGYSVSRSRKTGRVRYIGMGGAHLATIRASDGFLVPGEGLAAPLSENTEYRVTVEDDAAVYVGEGRTVFAKHVVNAGEPVRPGDEVVVTNSHGVPVALGRAVLPGRDMVLMKRGKAVKTRRGLYRRDGEK